MKKSGFKILLTTSTMVFMLISCEVFVPDPIDPRLPIYSEVGRNMGGAKVGNQFFKNDVRPLFLSSNRNENQNIDVGDSRLVLNFNFWNQSHSESIRLNIELNGLSGEDWSAMEKGYGKKFVFSETNIATLSAWEEDDFISVPFEGQVTVKILKNGNIVAGTFGFKSKDTADNEIMVTYGRYDYIYSKF